MSEPPVFSLRFFVSQCLRNFNRLDLMLANLNDWLSNCQLLHRMLERVFVFYHSSRAHRSLSNEFWVIKVKVAQKSHQTIGNLFPKPKDPVPKDQTRGAIYSIPCKDCDKSYIGGTKRKFSTRLEEHQKAVDINTRKSQL